MSDEAPEGYRTPKSAAELMEHAAANGWQARLCWFAGGEITEPFLKIEVGRRLTPGEDLPVNPADEYAPVRGDFWRYLVTWHSRGARPGTLRLFRSPGCATPWNPSYHTGTSAKAVFDMIARFPDPKN